MNIEMDSKGPKLEIAFIIEIEQQMKCKLPAAYKNFLEIYNGGEPIQNTIDFNGSEIRQFSDSIACFYEASSDISYGLSPNLKNHGYLLPFKMIFIANTPAGNYFLLSLRDDSYGQLFYKDHEFEDTLPFEPNKNILPESMVKVADSFDEFISMLYDPDDV